MCLQITNWNGKCSTVTVVEVMLIVSQLYEIDYNILKTEK